MAIGYSGLKNELNTDPLNLGYSGNLFIGNDQGNANLLNSLSGAGAASVFRNDIQPKEIVNVIQPSDFNAGSQLQISKLNLLFVAAPIDATLVNVRANFQNIFSGATPATISGLAAVASRTGSRGEVLFGAGTFVSALDINIARHT